MRPLSFRRSSICPFSNHTSVYGPLVFLQLDQLRVDLCAGVSGQREDELVARLDGHALRIGRPFRLFYQREL